MSKQNFAQKADFNPLTVADQYEAQGIILEAANDDRINGWAEVLKLFGDPLIGNRTRKSR